MPDTRYESDQGTIHKIRLDAATIAAAGTAPAGAVNSSIRAKVSKTNREFGLRPRYALLGRDIDAGAAGLFKKYKILPILTPAAYESAAFADNSTITIGGVQWTVVAKNPEDY